MRKTRFLLFCLFFIGFHAITVSGFTEGIFDGTADWTGRGQNKAPGSIEVQGSGESAVYTLQGNGDDIWETSDEGFFAYTTRAGNWSLQGKVKWISPGGNHDWAKVGFMIRDNPDNAQSSFFWTELRAGRPDSNNLHGDAIDVQWRNGTGSFADGTSLISEGENPVSPDRANGIWLRVTRLADQNLFYSHYSKDGIDWIFSGFSIIPMSDSIAYGLAISNHMDNTDLAVAEFTDVKIIPAVIENFSAIQASRSHESEADHNVPIPVKIRLTAFNTSEDISMYDTPPAGCQISNISHGGTFHGDRVVWSISQSSLVNSKIELSYEITCPDSMTDLRYEFLGMVNDSIPIGGNNVLFFRYKGVQIFRSCSPAPFNEGETGTGSLRVQVNDSVPPDGLAIEEYFPNGLGDPSNISNGGVWNSTSHSIRWFFTTIPQTAITYTVTLGNSDMYDFAMSRSYGSLLVNNEETIINIEGDRVWEKNRCQPHPIDTNENYEIDTSELLLAASSWKKGNPQPTLTDLLKAATLWKKGDKYICDGNGNYLSENNSSALVVPSYKRKVSIQQDTGVSATRSFSGQNPEHPVTVTIHIDTSAAIDAMAIEEVVPDGWNVKTVSGGGEYNPTTNTIRWFLLSNFATDLIFALEPSSYPGSFSGSITYISGIDEKTISIEGENVLEQAPVANTTPTPTPVGTGGTILAERAYYFLVLTPDTWGAQITITSENVDTLTVIEEPPVGWEVSNVSHGGVYQNGQIVWNLTPTNPENSNFKLGYDIKAGPNVTMGTYQTYGTVNGIEIAGTSQLYQMLQNEVVGLRSFSGSCITGEPRNVSIQITTQVAIDALAIEESVPPGSVVTDINNGGEYHSESGTIRWFLLSEFNTKLQYTIIPAPGPEYYSGTMTVAYDGDEIVSGIGGELICSVPPSPTPGVEPTSTPMRETPFPTETHTATPVPTSTPVPVPTSTSTPTPFSTATNTPVSIPTPTSIATPTATFTPTQTPTFTPTVTPSPTSTPTYTPSPTSTPTHTPTFTPTVAPSPTFTPTWTATSTPAPTVPPTPTVPKEPETLQTVNWSEVTQVGGGIDNTLPRAATAVRGDIMRVAIRSNGEVATLMGPAIPVQGTALISVMVKSRQENGILNLGALDQDYSGTVTLQTKINLNKFKGTWGRFTTIITPEAGGVIPILQVVGVGDSYQVVEFKDFKVYELKEGLLLDAKYLSWFMPEE